ncbi:tyrosine-type recombinase/integrase [bacterium]|nr:tyrosine-type recombinase/integrase [bacterium]
MRHTFASYMRQRGADLDIVSKLLGHKNLRMTQRYASHVNGTTEDRCKPSGGLARQ